MQRYTLKQLNRRILCILILFTIIYTIFSFSSTTMIKSYAATYTYTSASNDLPSNFDTKYPGYKSLIQSLINTHPNWTFKLYETGLDWETVINNEYQGHGGTPKNLVPAYNSNYSGGWICSICGTHPYDTGDWYCASKEAIQYMMDPRNSINETDVFQFQELSYSDSNNNGYTIDNSGKYIIVDPSMTISNISGGENLSNIFGTGANISLNSSTYNLVMLGDANGDGVINSGDLLALKKHLLGTQVISDKSKLLAIDSNLDSSINSGDLLTIKKHLLGTAVISNLGNTADREAIAKMVSGTFINSTECINALFTAANKYNVSPYHLVSRILQEQGTKGSTLGLGITENGVTYYNLFNVGASGNSQSTVIANGLATAKSKGWTSMSAAIIGGAEFVAKNYIAVGQNTLYYQKFNVVNKNNLYGHQYMQNILAAQNEGSTIRSKYISYGILDSRYAFIIPLYTNMPKSTSPRPSTNSYTEEGERAYINAIGGLALRDAPNGNTLCYVNEGVEILITQRASSKIDGIYWDKVVTPKGTGYMARGASDGSKTYLVTF